jgi:hypothetical protein
MQHFSPSENEVISISLFFPDGIVMGENHLSKWRKIDLPICCQLNFIDQFRWPNSMIRRTFVSIV